MIPQIIILIWLTLSLGVILAKDGQPSKYNFWATFISYVLIMTVLYWGGFWEPLLGH